MSTITLTLTSPEVEGLRTAIAERLYALEKDEADCFDGQGEPRELRADQIEEIQAEREVLNALDSRICTAMYGVAV